MSGTHTSDKHSTPGPANIGAGQHFRMIHFRQVDYPGKDNGIFWHVEFFLDDEPQTFPVGTAYAVATGGAAQLNFILVADGWRRKGIGARLVEACQQRWPNLQYTSAMSESGEGLISKAFPKFED